MKDRLMILFGLLTKCVLNTLINSYIVILTILLFVPCFISNNVFLVYMKNIKDKQLLN